MTTNNQLSPIVTNPNLYVNNFDVTWASNTTLSINYGQCRDSNNIIDMYLFQSTQVPSTAYVSAPLTLNTAVVGINGVDATLVVSKLYDLYIIESSDGAGPIGCIATLASNSTPTMPSGYDTMRKIYSFAVDSSGHILKGYVSGNQVARFFTFDTPQTALNAGSSTSYGTGAVDLSALVPWVDNTRVLLNFDYAAASAGNSFQLQGFNSTGDAVDIIAPVVAATAHTTGQCTVLAQLNAASSPVGKPEINYKVANGSDTLTLKVVGFAFNL